MAIILGMTEADTNKLLSGVFGGSAAEEGRSGGGTQQAAVPATGGTYNMTATLSGLKM